MNEPHLSDRERTVLLLAAEGLTDKEIARKLGLSHKTIGTYWDRMREKFSASSRTQVLAQFLRIQLGENVLDGDFCLKLFSEWHDGVWVIDKDGKTIYSNDVAKDMVGASEELNHLSLGNGNSSRLKKLFSGTRAEATTLEVQHTINGDSKLLRLRAIPFRDGRGRASATLVHIQDHSDLSALSKMLLSSESALEFLLEHAGDCVARFDCDLRVTSVNPTLLAVHQVTQDDLLGQHVSDLAHVFAPNERWVNGLSRALKSGRKIKFSAELPHLIKKVPTFVMADARKEQGAHCITSVTRCGAPKRPCG